MNHYYKKLTAFKILGSFFLSDKKKQLVIIEKKVDHLIDSNLFGLLREYRSSGYILTSKQHKKFVKSMLSLKPHSMIKQLDHDIMNGIVITDKDLAIYFPAYSSINYINDITEEQYQEHTATLNNNLKKKTPKLFNISKTYDKKLQSLDFTCLLMQQWNKNFNSYLSEKSLFTSYSSEDISFVQENLVNPLSKYNNNILLHKNIDELKIMQHKINKFITKINKKYSSHTSSYSDTSRSAMSIVSLFKKILTHVDSNIQKIYIKDLADTKQNIQLLYVDNYMDELIIKESMKMIEKTNIKDLPPIASDLLFTMKENYISLYKKLDSFNTEEQFSLQNLWEKRVPEIISKYLHIDKEDRLTMFNRNNQNAEQLMLESLHNINTHFIHLKKNKNEEHLTELSITHKYTKNVNSI